MAAKKKTKEQITAEKNEKALLNPITKKPANTYTQALGVDLPNPVKSEMPKRPTDPYVKMTQRRSQKRASEYDAQRTGRKIEDVPVYGTVDMDEVGWKVEGSMMRNLMGFDGNSKTPNVTSGPSINEPHTPNPDVVVGRRAEDLTGLEHRAVTAKLGAYGVTEERAARHIRDASDRANMRSILGGSTSVAGSGFYGGPSKPNTRMKATANMVVSHPLYEGSPEQAWAVTSVANSDTSPRAKFEHTYADGRGTIYPNAAAAETAITHVLDGHDPKYVPKAPHGGIHGNTIKAAKDTQALVNGASVSDLFPWEKNPKTSAYVSAHISASHPDSYRTNDVLSTTTAMPHLDTRKQHKFNVQDSSGNLVVGADEKPIVHQFEAEDIHKSGVPNTRHARSRLKHFGLTGTYVPAMGSDNKPAKGSSPSEELLARGGPPAHAVLDRAGRVAAAASGKTPSVNHAQAQNQMQEHDWRDRQILRSDMSNTFETEHPGGLARMGMSQQFNVFDHSTWGTSQQFKGQS